MKKKINILVLFDGDRLYNDCYEGIFSTEKDIEKHLKKEHSGENPFVIFQFRNNEFRFIKRKPICDITVHCEEYSVKYYYIKETLKVGK